MKPATDAIGNLIEQGSTYGYSINKNGFTDSFIGEAVKITSEGKITLKVLKRFRALYSDNVRAVDIGRAHVNVKCNMLFKL